jgi:hypothetical protein
MRGWLSTQVARGRGPEMWLFNHAIALWQEADSVDLQTHGFCS